MAPQSKNLGYYSAITLTVLVILIDIGMITSNLLYPTSSITNIQTYAALFTSLQMLPFIPSLILAPVFSAFMLAIYHQTPPEKKIYGQLAFGFAIICTAILSLHYYVQLTFVQQSILAGELDGVWQFAAPNPHGFFWTFAALGYGFMGLSLIMAVPTFDKTVRLIRWLLIANGALGTLFLVGNALGVFVVDILVSFVWGAFFPVTTILIAKRFKKKDFEAEKAGSA